MSTPHDVNCPEPSMCAQVAWPLQPARRPTGAFSPKVAQIFYEQWAASAHAAAAREVDASIESVKKARLAAAAARSAALQTALVARMQPYDANAPSVVDQAQKAAVATENAALAASREAHQLSMLIRQSPGQQVPNRSTV